MGYTPVSSGGDYTQAQGAQGSFPGTGAGSAPLDISNQWANARVVTAPAHQVAGNAVNGQRTLTSGVISAKTIGQMLLEFDTSQADPAQVTELQQLLWNGGFYGTGKKPTFTPGERDDKTRTAFVKALKEAARSQSPFGSFLDERAQARVTSGLAGAASTVHTNIIQHRSLADVDSGALAGFQAALGRAPTAKEAAAFTAGYRTSETKAQPDTSSGGTFTVTDPGSPQTAAAEYARTNNQGTADDYSRLQAFNVMLKTLGVAA